MMELYQLTQLQSLPLSAKVWRTECKIREWYSHWRGQVYVSFSGGKDSTVLLHIVRSIYPEVPAVFFDTGLEFPEIRDFVKSFDNVTFIKPKMNFRKVIEHYGYPVVSKETSQNIRQLTTMNLSDRFRNKLLHGDERGNARKLAKKWWFLMKAPFKISEQCCDVMKKRPAHQYEKEMGRKPFVGMMAGDSRLRKQRYMRLGGCNAFDIRRPQSNPLSLWNEDNVWEFLRSNNIPYSPIYDMGYGRTGCMYCMFGTHMEKDNRFDRMARTHPKIYKYCMESLGLSKIIDFVNSGGK